MQQHWWHARDVSVTQGAGPRKRATVFMSVAVNHSVSWARREKPQCVCLLQQSVVSDLCYHCLPASEPQAGYPHRATDKPQLRIYCGILSVSACFCQGHGRATQHKPELVLNNFGTRLGRRVGRMFASLFPQVSVTLAYALLLRSLGFSVSEINAGICVLTLQPVPTSLYCPLLPHRCISLCLQRITPPAPLCMLCLPPVPQDPP